MPKDENTSNDSPALPGCQELFSVLPDYLLVVSGRRTIVQATHALAEKLGLDATRFTGSLDHFIEQGTAFGDYLALCTGSRGFLPGAITFLIDGTRTTFRADGALLRRGATRDLSHVLFRLTLRESSLNRFLTLNHRIDDLSQEIVRRQSLETQLREEREWFKTTLASLGDGVIATDAEGRITFINPVAEKLTGWPLREASGQLLTTVFHIVNEQTRRAAEDPVARVLAEGMVIGLANHTILVNKDGKEYAIEDSAAPIHNGEQGIIGVVLVFHDVTEKRETEHALQRSQAALYDRVQELERFHDVVVGRELKMIELEKEIEQLRAILKASRPKDAH